MRREGKNTGGLQNAKKKRQRRKKLKKDYEKDWKNGIRKNENYSDG